MTITTYEDGSIYDSEKRITTCPGKGLQRSPDGDGWVEADEDNFPPMVIKDLTLATPLEAEGEEEALINDVPDGYETKTDFKVTITVETTLHGNELLEPVVHEALKAHMASTEWTPEITVLDGKATLRVETESTTYYRKVE